MRLGPPILCISLISVSKFVWLFLSSRCAVISPVTFSTRLGSGDSRTLLISNQAPNLAVLLWARNIVCRLRLRDRRDVSCLPQLALMLLDHAGSSRALQQPRWGRSPERDVNLPWPCGRVLSPKAPTTVTNLDKRTAAEDICYRYATVFYR